MTAISTELVRDQPREMGQFKALRAVLMLAEITLGANIVFWIVEATAAWAILTDRIDLFSQSIWRTVTAAESLYGLLLLVTAVAFISWSYRAHANLSALGRSAVRHDSRATIWWWLVPFASFVLPYRVIYETVRGSTAPPNANDWHDSRLPLVAKLWTGLFLVGLVAAQVASRVIGVAESVEEFRSAAVLLVIASVLLIGSAITAIIMVRMVTEAQLSLASNLWPDIDTRRPAPPLGHGTL